MKKVRVCAAGVATVNAIAAALLFMACSSDTTGPASAVSNGGRDDGDIYGYTYNNLNQIITGVDVSWTCINDSAALGTDTSDANGRYDIYAYS